MNVLGDIGFNLLKPTVCFSVPGTSVTADGNSTGVDLRDAAGRAWTLAVFLGDVTGTSPTLAIQVQESADNSTFASIAGATVTVSDADENGLVTLLITGMTKRYARLTYDISGSSTPTFPICAAALLQNRVAGSHTGASISPQT